MRKSEGTGNPVNGDLSREHWIVPVQGLSGTALEGTVQAVARPDGTVIMHLTCGDSQIKVRLDVSRAAQLSTGIWEAATAATRRLTTSLGDDPLPSPHGAAEDLPQAWLAPRSAPPRNSSPRGQRTTPPMNQNAALDIPHTIGVRIRRIRTARNKSLRVVAGLAGMSCSTLWRVERGQREPTLSETVSLAAALQVDPVKLITLPILVPTHS